MCGCIFVSWDKAAASPHAIGTYSLGTIFGNVNRHTMHWVACFKLTDSQFPVNCDLSLSDHPESQYKKCPIERVKWSGVSPEALAFQCDLTLPTQQWKAHFSAVQDILITMGKEKQIETFALCALCCIILCCTLRKDITKTQYSSKFWQNSYHFDNASKALWKIINWFLVNRERNQYI